jgi:ATP-dependent RNA circularization protein (DNA/RNA ligase family)
MIDASHIKVHQHGAGARGGNQAMERIKGGSIARYTWPWMRMVCRSEFLLQKVPQLIVHNLMVGMNATYLLADKAYDTNDLLEKIAEQNMQAVIPPKKNRVLLRTYDKDLYKLHHLVENAFLHLKR